MSKDKIAKSTQAIKIVKYTHVIQQKEAGGTQGETQPTMGTTDSTMADLLLAVNNSRNEMVVKIDSVAIDVALLRTDSEKWQTG